MNSDGAFAVTEGVAGGGIARDNGGFKGAWFKVYQAMTDPLTIEVVALEFHHGIDQSSNPVSTSCTKLNKFGF
jgi:hypothetical protein